MKIEIATIEDVPEILELQNKAFYPVAEQLNWLDAPNLTETVNQAREDFPKFTVLKMVDENGKIIGSVRGNVDDGSLYIGRLMVLPEFQQNGYSRLLFHKIQELLPHRRVWLETSADIPSTYSFYEREGFSTFKTDHFDNGISWVSMEKLSVMSAKAQNKNPDDFDSLVKHIEKVGNVLRQDAHVVINRNITTRAWLTGCYIVEYEQNGNDRAKYGDQLLQNISQRLGGKSYSVTNLRSYRLFYILYPELRPIIGKYLIQRFGDGKTLTQNIDFLPDTIQHSLTAESASNEKQQSATAELSVKNNQPSVTKISSDGFAMILSDGSVSAVPQMLFNRLSFTHIVQLLHVENALQRAFYAIEAMRGPWSVRELQRQIDSNYFTRSGWSKKPELLAQKINNEAEPPSFEQDIKSPYCFEFLGLSAKAAIDENNLESAIVSHLKEFIMELGMGFCLEDEQKRLLIDDRYFKVDLVFYHRILKCHCIVELKAHRLDYADVAQLNMYIEYYRKHYMQPDDNPPVGLLLCTEYGQEMAEYLAPFIDPKLFVARYELQLPSKDKIQDFLMRENRR